jgi:hypothetical protein
VENSVVDGLRYGFSLRRDNAVEAEALLASDNEDAIGHWHHSGGVENPSLRKALDQANPGRSIRTTIGGFGPNPLREEDRRSRVSGLSYSRPTPYCHHRRSCTQALTDLEVPIPGADPAAGSRVSKRAQPGS